MRVRTPDAEKLPRALGTAGAELDGPDGALFVTGVDAAAVGAAALSAGVVLHELFTDRPDLEHVFLELTHGKAAIR